MSVWRSLCFPIRRLTTLGALATAWIGAGGRDRLRSGRRTVAGLAPDPATTHEPVVQFYGARCRGLLGFLGMHTWIAVKGRGASSFTFYEVIGGRLRVRGSVLAIRRRSPDSAWCGNAPELLADQRGEGVDTLISRIEAAVREYPYANEYLAWPGPNSNTFSAHVARAIPELEVDLPPTAIGKDYLGDRLATTAPSGHGFQLSLFGLLGVLASPVEGLEVNVLGLSWGIDPFSPALKVPLLGRIGAARVSRPPRSVARTFMLVRPRSGVPLQGRLGPLLPYRADRRPAASQVARPDTSVRVAATASPSAAATAITLPTAPVVTSTACKSASACSSAR